DKELWAVWQGEYGDIPKESFVPLDVVSADKTSCDEPCALKRSKWTYIVSRVMVLSSKSETLNVGDINPQY
ncbi:hypothetical protein PAXRUDRAFT_774275, partial [Paxillus rubicundulus Ve08.2h10]